MKIGGLIKTSYNDFPKNLATVIFTSGCNLSCHYCHNGNLVKGEVDDKLTLPWLTQFLTARQQHVNAVVISGGEPTLHLDLIEVIRTFKSLGMKVKLDTNGTHPEVVEKLLSEKLLDYIAMDLKWLPEDYAPFLADASLSHMKWFWESIELIQHSGVPHEFRTTVLKPYHDEAVLSQIYGLVPYADRFVLQQYRFVETQLTASHFDTYPFEAIEKMKHKIEKNVPILIRAKV